jgi:NAD(P)-dependent dehydrogenase (short-subunit alcohol dehydrogenase family)
MVSPSLDCVVIISGAARGLGRAMALGVAAAGACVAALDLQESEPALAELARTASDRGWDRIFPIVADVTDASDSERAAKAVIDRFGAVHAVVSNAAQGMQDIGFGSHSKKFFDVREAEWRSTFNVNVLGPFIMAKLLAPGFVKQGWGRIINITTSLTTMVAASFSPYGPSKAALEAATAIWAKDLSNTGVTVNALLPGGPANTRMIPRTEVPERIKLIRPESMIAPLKWLLSKESDGVSGRRFIAKEWDPTLSPEEAAKRAEHSAGLMYEFKTV